MTVNSDVPRSGNLTALAAASVLGLLLFGIADLISGFLGPGPDVGGVNDLLGTLLVVLAHCAVVGFMGGAVAILLRRSATGIPQIFGGRVDVFRLLGTVVLSALLIWLHTDTFSGPRIRGHPSYLAILWGFRCSTPILVWISLALVRLAVTWTSSSVRIRWGVTLAFVLVGMVTLKLNTTVLVGLYPGLHAQLVIMSAFAFVVAAHVLVAPSRIRTRNCILFGALLIVISLGFRTSAGSRSVLSNAHIRGQSTRIFSFYTEPMFRWIVTPPKLVVPDLPELSGDNEAVLEQIQSYLDTALPGRRRMNLLFITVDTLRADHTTWGGSTRNTTPHMQSLAEESWVFSRAYTPYPTSNFAYASLFTGLLPRATPAYSRLEKKGWSFPEKLTLADILSDAGWETIGVTAFDRRSSNDPGYFGPLKRGFNIYNPDQTEAAADADHVTRSFLASLASGSARPFFGWVHYLDPHDPYRTWEGFDFGDSTEEAYDSEIAFVDHHVGLLLEGLKKRGEFDQTIIVVLSDHGEEFREHGARYHNSAVYDQQIHVPLLVRVPGLSREKEVAKNVVNLVDLMSTALGLLGVRDDTSRHGRNLLPMMLESETEAPHWSYSEHYVRFGGHLARNPRAIIEGEHKLIWNRMQDTYELYNLSLDQLERNNLVGHADEVEARLRGLMKKVDEKIDAFHSATGAGINPGEEFQLEADTAMEDLRTDDKAAGNRAATAFRKLLLDYAGDPSPKARSFLGNEGMEDVSNRLIELWKQCDPEKERPSRRRIKIAVSELHRKSAVPFMRERVRELNADTLKFATGLALNGDDGGRAILLRALGNPAADMREVAVGLAHLGENPAAPWVTPVLTSVGGWKFHAQMFDALPKFEQPLLSFALRDFVLDGLWTQPPLLRHLADAFGRLPANDQARWILARLTLFEDPLVSEAARRSLREAGVDEEAYKAMQPALEAEVDGDKAATNGFWDLAFRKYAEALEHCRPLGGEIGFNAALRLRYARYLQLEGQVKQARKILEEVANSAPHAVDKTLATRRLTMVDQPARLTDISRFGAHIENFNAPQKVRFGHAFKVTFDITNTGTDPWQGGYWRFPVSFTLRWTKDDGSLMPMGGFVPRTFLAPEGLAPGEKTSIQLMGTSAPVRAYSAKPAIVFQQPWFKPPNQGIVFRGAEAIDVSVNLR